MDLKQIVFWGSTGLLCVAMLGGGIANSLHLEMVRADIIRLGYPEYVLSILGAAKLSAAVVIAAPNLLRLKEWAYAGVTIDLVGAAISHIVVGDPIFAILRPLLLLSIGMTSYFLRPDARRLA